MLCSQCIKPDNPAYSTMSAAYDKNGTEEVSLQQLRALAAVAESGSFTLAAESLQLTQPAISHLVKRMEDQLGQPLMVRGRRIRLTDAGQMMVDTAVRALRLIDESVDACRSQSQLREGRVVLAVGHLTAGALLPPMLGRFSQQHPTLATTLMDSTAEQMISRILSQEADLGFGSDIGQKHSELATEPLFSERMAVFVRDDHPLAQRVVIDARHLDHRRERGRRQDEVLHVGHDRAVLLGLGACLVPFRIGAERGPLLLAIRERLPRHEVIQRLARLADHRGPEASLLDAVLLPQTQRDGVETLQQIGQTARHALIHAQFVQHDQLPPKDVEACVGDRAPVN